MPPSKLKPAKPEAKTEDPKKQKKFEKEEKEFRKKFKVLCIVCLINPRPSDYIDISLRIISPPATQCFLKTHGASVQTFLHFPACKFSSHLKLVPIYCQETKLLISSPASLVFSHNEHTEKPATEKPQGINTSVPSCI